MDNPQLTPLSHHSQCPRTLQTAKGPIEYLDFGKGPVIVAMHGALGGYDQSAILAETVLDGNFRVLAISRPGYLGTPISAGATPAQQADLVAALLDALGIESAGIIAISGGGPCAISFALQYPGRCGALVLISTLAGINRFAIPLRFHLMKLLARVPFIVRSMRRKALENLDATAARSITDSALRRQMLSEPKTRTLFAALAASTSDRMAQRIAGTDNDIRITQTTEYRLEEIAVPTLIVHGDHDPVVNFEQHAEQAAARIPGAELLTLEGGEHAAIFTHRQLVADRIPRFLASNCR